MPDYVIIGGGSAGCVLAHRLTAKSGVSAALVEAGGKSTGLLHRLPAGFFQLMKTGKANWNEVTTPQPGLAGRQMYVPLGKALGGSGAINAMVWVRGNPGDYDGWATGGADGWSYRDCLPYFKRAETYRGEITGYRGDQGPIKVSPGPPLDAMAPISRAWIDAAIAAGYSYNSDTNGERQEGFGPADGNFADGIRQSAASAYLEPVRKRPNLQVLTDAHVTRILIEKGRATGAEFVRSGRVERILADKEVILAAGAIHSPQILQLSGIADPAMLQQHGIAVQVALPGVGRNLHDHVAISLQQAITQPYSALRMLRPKAMATALLQYLLWKKGPLVTGGLQALAFVKSDPELPYPDIQYHLPMLMYGDHGRDVIPLEGFMAHATACLPKSRGSVQLQSADPLASPLIDPRYLEAEEDIAVLRQSIRIARDIIRRAPFDSCRGAEYAPGADVVSDADLDAYIRANAMSVYHLAGTCRMGNDDQAVVTPDLKVRGMQKLRVIDASIMPRLVTGNTNSAVIMIAEKASEMILAE